MHCRGSAFPFVAFAFAALAHSLGAYTRQPLYILGLQASVASIDRENETCNTAYSVHQGYFYATDCSEISTARTKRSLQHSRFLLYRSLARSKCRIELYLVCGFKETRSKECRLSGNRAVRSLAVKINIRELTDAYKSTTIDKRLRGADVFQTSWRD